MYSTILNDYRYVDLVDETVDENKYVFYECFYHMNGAFGFEKMENKNQRNSCYSVIIPIHKYIPTMFHKQVLMFYYDKYSKPK
jgi:hypothetical protein